MQLAQLNPQQADDYRSSMQQAAAAFIQRHQAEHLHDDGLFERTVRYLVTALEVPAFMADRIVHLAMSARLPAGKAWVGVDTGNGPDRTAVLVHDHRTGINLLLPCRHLPGRFLAAPATR